MAIEFNDNPSLHDHRLKSQRLMLEASSGTSGESSDLAGVATVTSTDAANGQFTVSLALPAVAKIYKAEVTPDSGTATVAASITASGMDLAVDSSLDLSAGDVTVTLEIDYKEA